MKSESIVRCSACRVGVVDINLQISIYLYTIKSGCVFMRMQKASKIFFFKYFRSPAKLSEMYSFGYVGKGGREELKK